MKTQTKQKLWLLVAVGMIISLFAVMSVAVHAEESKNLYFKPTGNDAGLYENFRNKAYQDLYRGQGNTWKVENGVLYLNDGFSDTSIALVCPEVSKIVINGDIKLVGEPAILAANDLEITVQTGSLELQTPNLQELDNPQYSALVVLPGSKPTETTLIINGIIMGCGASEDSYDKVGKVYSFSVGDGYYLTTIVDANSDYENIEKMQTLEVKYETISGIQLKNVKITPANSSASGSTGINPMFLYYMSLANKETPKIKVLGEYTYTGKAQLPNLKVTLASTELVKDKDYIITKCEDNIDAGTATAYIKFQGTYSMYARQTVKFDIGKATLTASLKAETVKLGETPKYEITYKGFVNDETTETAKKFVVPVTIRTLPERAGRFIMLIGKGEAANYTFVYKSAIITVIE